MRPWAALLFFFVGVDIQFDLWCTYLLQIRLNGNDLLLIRRWQLQSGLCCSKTTHGAPHTLLPTSLVVYPKTLSDVCYQLKHFRQQIKSMCLFVLMFHDKSLSGSYLSIYFTWSHNITNAVKRKVEAVRPILKRCWLGRQYVVLTFRLTQVLSGRGPVSDREKRTKVPPLGRLSPWEGTACAGGVPSMGAQRAQWALRRSFLPLSVGRAWHASWSTEKSWRVVLSFCEAVIL